MPVDPALQVILDQLEHSEGPALHEASVEGARSLMKGMAQLDGAPEPVGRVEDRAIPGPVGPIPVRI